MALTLLGFVCSALVFLGCGAEEPSVRRSEDTAEVHVAEVQQGLGAPVCVTIQRAGASGAVADTEIASGPGKANKNYGADSTFNTGKLGASTRQALIRFDLSAIPPGATIHSADMTLRGKPGASGDVQVHRITAPWSEQAVTWSSFNGAFAPAINAAFRSSSGPVSVSLIGLAQAWLGGASPNHGVLLEQPPPHDTQFLSSEATPAKDRPKLVVCYTPDPCAGVVCAASGPCHVAGTCDPATGQCSNPVAADGAACSDGNACTQSDTCQAGACVAANPVTCSAADACHVAGACNPATGQCSNPPGPDGTACSDGNAATEFDTCQAGACTGANSVVITIQSPANGAILGTSTAQITGTLSEAATVTIGATPAVVSGLSFSANVPLHEGNNILAVAATGATGNPGAASVIVVHDTTPPRVAITAPGNHAVVAGNTATITGTVQDLLIGTVNPGDCSVTVNGVPATVENRGFRAEGVPIAAGAGTVTAIATDLAGNTASTVISITGDMTSNAMIFAAGGDGQSGVVGTALAQPFTAFVSDNTGTAMPDIPVTFKVTRGNGLLPAGARSATVLSDAQGFASTTLTLGSTTGAASDQVVATAPAFLGAAIFAANGAVDPAGARVLTVASGGNQKGVSGKLASQPLGVLLADDKGNPITGQSVSFTVLQGGGRVNGASTITRTTDTDGRAYVLFTLGPALGAGSQFVEATAPGANGVHFVASTLEEGPPGETQVSGVVLTNENDPIVNVFVSIKGTSLGALTGAEGRFALPGAPVGPVHLEVDGTTAGPFPTLSFDLDLISGADNTMERPIYLPAVDTDGMGTANPSTDIVLRRGDTPGLSLTVKAGSATFNGVSKTGAVQVIRVHRDKIPMLPPDGTLPSIAIAIMPHGASFNPPAPLRLPNVDGRPPGEVVSIYSFDHDLSAFVVVGTATVSEDGQEIVSEQGQGIVKGGWHLIPPTQAGPTCVGGNKCHVKHCTNSSGQEACTLEEITTCGGSGTIPTTTAPWNPDVNCYPINVTTLPGCNTGPGCPPRAALAQGTGCVRGFAGVPDPAHDICGQPGTCEFPCFCGDGSCNGSPPCSETVANCPSDCASFPNAALYPRGFPVCCPAGHFVPSCADATKMVCCEDAPGAGSCCP